METLKTPDQPPKLTKQEEIELIRLLKQWFDSNDLDKAHFLARNRVAKVLKRELCRRNRWANKKAPKRAAHLRQFRFE